MSPSPSRRRRGALLLAGVLLCSAAACGRGADEPVGRAAGSSAAAGAPRGATPPASPLDGRSFVATATAGVTVVPGTAIVLSFLNGSLSVYAGCNTMLGPVTLTAGVLDTGPLASTMIACDQPLMAQDAWLGAFLESLPAWTLSGDVLVLDDGSRSITLQAQ